MTDLTIANTIRQQLGGQFALMTGARRFTGDANSLSFWLPPCDFKLKEISRVKITLTPMDVYRMEFWAGGDLVEIVEDVYCDMLHDVFERVTGLLTTLTPRRGEHRFG